MIKQNSINVMKLMMSPRQLERVSIECKISRLLIALRELRLEQNIRQEDIKGFSQPAISKLESRSDMRLSTLLKYIDALGYDITIQVSHKENPSVNYILLDTTPV
jgi:hypothetical protein